MAAASLASPRWIQNRRKRVFHSVFQTEISQPTPYSTPLVQYPEQGQPFGGPPTSLVRHRFFDEGTTSFAAPATAGQLQDQHLHALRYQPVEEGQRADAGSSRPLFPPGSPSSTDALPPPSSNDTAPASQLLTHAYPSTSASPSAAAAAGDQIRFDRAWHVVTSAIALPPSATADDSFGTLPPESQYAQLAHRGSGEAAELQAALEVVLDPRLLVPRALHTEDVFEWHTQQVRRHFAAHVLPLLAACAEGPGLERGFAGAGDDADGGDADDDDAYHYGEEMELDEDEPQRGRRARGGGVGGSRKSKNRYYEANMIVVMSSVRTLEGALRLYFHGATLIARGLKQQMAGGPGGIPDSASRALERFQRDVHALVGNSASPAMMKALRVVLVRLTGVILGFPAPEDTGHRSRHSTATSWVARQGRPKPPTQDNLQAEAARRRLTELIASLCDVGLAGEKFQVLFAEVMDCMMSAFIKGSYAGVWTTPKDKEEQYRRGSYEAPVSTLPRVAALSSPSWCTLSLCDWTENHFARLTHDVLNRISSESTNGEYSGSTRKQAVTLSDVKRWQEMALGRLATLRIAELFDIVLAWPASRAGLDDLRAAVATPQRRKQLTDSFSAALQRRLLHPGRSTLEILQTYIAMIHTFHTLDHSKVLLGRVVPQLQLYLCQRDDAVRIVVTGLLASEEEVRAAQGSGGGREPASSSRGERTGASRDDDATADDDGAQASSSASRPSGTASNKLVELAVLLNDPSQQQQRKQPSASAVAPEDPELDWADMDWMPDPIDAGANYRRPRSEDVIGTLIGALGSPDSFIKEFQAIMAERLLSGQASFAQEMRVLALMRRRFGEAALQNCEVMVRDVRDSVRLDGAIKKVEMLQAQQQQQQQQPNEGEGAKDAASSPDDPEYHARILSRLFWPNLARERFVVPPPVGSRQRVYEQGYEHLKSTRKLTWLDHLGQATVELELRDRTLSVDCKTYEAAVIYAFQDPNGGAEDQGKAQDHGRTAPREIPGSPTRPVRRTAEDLQEQLSMDEELLVAALGFWTAKGVLRRDRRDGYVVAETLGDAGGADGRTTTAAADDDDDNERDEAGEDKQASGGAAAPTNTPAGPGTAGSSSGGGGGKSSDPRRAVYWQYVVGMLTNASAQMPLAQIAMMLKMLVPDGFPWSSEELREFLAEKTTAGELEVAGGKYRLPRK